MRRRRGAAPVPKQAHQRAWRGRQRRGALISDHCAGCEDRDVRLPEGPVLPARLRGLRT